MAAPKGNQFWKARAKHGRDKIFKTPEDLRAACIEYFEWVDSNPLYERKVFHAAGVLTEADVPKMRAMTISGLCIFLGVTSNTWSDYRGREDFIRVTREVEEVIRTQKFEGAAAEFLNANIIARDLGLKDKTEMDLNANHKHTIENMTDEELDDEIAKLGDDLKIVK